MRKILLFIIGIVLIALAYLGAKALVDSNKRVRPKAAKVVKTVFTEEVQNSTIPIKIASNGSLMAKNRLELFSEVQGVFQSSARDFKTGQQFNRGQQLVRINSAEYYTSVQASKSQFYNLITSLMPDLRLDYPEAFPIWQAYLNSIDINKSIPALPDTTSEKVKYFITGRGVYSSYYNVKNLEQRLSKYSLSAPFSGILTEALVTKGTLIRPGQKLGEFIDTSVYEVELAVEMAFSNLLRLNEEVKLTSLDGGDSYTGKVTRINGKIDQASQTIKVFVEVRGEGLKEGMYLQAIIDAREETDAIQISRKLLVDESRLYVLRDSLLDIIDVNPVHFTEKDVVVKGVPNGTLILSRPVPGSYAGMLVKKYEEKQTDANTKSE